MPRVKCPKCGSTQTSIHYQAGIIESDNQYLFKQRKAKGKRTDEHLHANCNRCGYPFDVDCLGE